MSTQGELEQARRCGVRAYWFSSNPERSHHPYTEAQSDLIAAYYEGFNSEKKHAESNGAKVLDSISGVMQSRAAELFFELGEGGANGLVRERDLPRIEKAFKDLFSESFDLVQKLKNQVIELQDDRENYKLVSVRYEQERDEARAAFAVKDRQGIKYCAGVRKFLDTLTCILDSKRLVEFDPAFSLEQKELLRKVVCLKNECVVNKEELLAVKASFESKPISSALNIELLKQDLKECRSIVETLRADKHKLEQERDQLLAANSALVEERDLLIEESKTGVDQHTILDWITDALNGQPVDSKAQDITIVQRVVELRSCCESLVIGNSQLNLEIDALKIRLQAADEGLLKCSDPSKSWQGITAECKVWQERAEKAERDLSEANSQLSAAKEQCLTIQTNCDSAIRERDDFSMQLDSALRRSEASKVECTIAKNELYGREHLYRTTLAKLDKIKQERDALRTTLADELARKKAYFEGGQI